MVAFLEVSNFMPPVIKPRSYLTAYCFASSWTSKAQDEAVLLDMGEYMQLPEGADPGTLLVLSSADLTQQIKTKASSLISPQRRPDVSVTRSKMDLKDTLDENSSMSAASLLAIDSGGGGGDAERAASVTSPRRASRLINASTPATPAMISDGQGAVNTNMTTVPHTPLDLMRIFQVTLACRSRSK